MKFTIKPKLMLEGIITAILMILGVLLTRSFTTLVHEYGHAIPALLFTNEKVEVYVGSYGNIENSLIFNIGRLTTYLKFNMLNWNIGLCRHRGDVSTSKNMLIVLGGPIASILLSIPLFKIYQTEGLSEIWLFLIPIFIGSAVYDFFINIIPMSSPMKMHDGTVTYNDGQQLLSLLAYANMPEEYLAPKKLYHEKKYDEAIAAFKVLIERKNGDPIIYIPLIDCLIQQKKYSDALNYYEKYAAKIPLKTNDFSTLGKLHLKLKNYDAALENLNKALFKNQHNVEDLAARGLVFIQFQDYQEAMFDLNNAVRLSKNFPDAYANRGLLHIRLNELEAAKWDLDKAFSLNENHPEAHLFLGYWYEKKGDFVSNKNALAAFQKAKKLGVYEPNLDWIIAEAERRINFNEG